jgi:hypothetical protein
LGASFGDTPFYVRFPRDSDAVVKSCIARKNCGLVKAYQKTLLCNLVLRKPKTDLTEIIESCIETITSSITYFLRDKTRLMRIRIETTEQDFPKLWDWIGAKGDLKAACMIGQCATTPLNNPPPCPFTLAQISRPEASNAAAKPTPKG